MKTLFIAVLTLLLSIFVFVLAQEKKPQLPCANGSKAFVLEASEIDAKIQELGREGYCVSKRHFTILGTSGKVLLMVNQDDLFSPGEEEEEEP